MAASSGFAPADVLAVAGMLFMGTIKTLLSKLMYGIQARGINGSMHSFEARPRARRTAAAIMRRLCHAVRGPRSAPRGSRGRLNSVHAVRLQAARRRAAAPLWGSKRA